VDLVDILVDLIVDLVDVSGHIVSGHRRFSVHVVYTWPLVSESGVFRVFPALHKQKICFEENGEIGVPAGRYCQQLHFALFIFQISIVRTRFVRVL
jgi:hypothetical protein